MSIIRQINRHFFHYYNQSVIQSPQRIGFISDRIGVNNKINKIWRMSSFVFSSLSDLKVEHNPKKHQFFVQLGKDKAVLEYRDVSPGVVDLFHTEVPKRLEGKGIAKLLAKEAFDFVVKTNQQMIVSCTFLQKYLNDNQKEEYLKVLHQTKD